MNAHAQEDRRKCFSSLRRRWVSPQSRRRSGERRRRRFGEVERLEARVLLAGDLVAHWRAHALLGEMDGGAVVQGWDDAVANVTAIASGQPVLVPNAIGGRAVVRFDAADGADALRVDRQQNPLAGAGDFSVVVVFATSSTQLEGGTAQWYRNTGLVDANQLGFNYDWGLSLNSAGQLSAGLGFGGGHPPDTLYSSADTLNDGQVHVAVLTRTGTSMFLYVDGQPDAVLHDTNDQPLAANDVTFGMLQTGGRPYTGDLAEVRFYDGALDSAELTLLFDELSAFYRNEPPTAVDDYYTMPEDLFFYSRPATFGVLANDHDAESDPLTAVLVDGPQHGVIILNPDGSFIYDPDRDFFGIDTFTYSAVDFRPSAPATVTFEVTPEYDPVDTVADSYKALPSSVLSVDSAGGVLANDENPDQVTLSAVLAEDVGQGQLTLRGDGSFDYDAQGFRGTTTFSYQVDDGTQLSAPVLVTLTVNTPPLANDDTYELTEDESLVTSDLLGVLNNDLDADGDTLTATLLSDPLHGTVMLNEDGGFSYIPPAEFSGSDQFRYRIDDGRNEFAEAIVRLNVVSVNDPPITTEDSYYALPDHLMSVSVERGLLANDVDVDGPQLTAILLNPPAHGTLTLNSDGSFQYLPKPGYTGTDIFSYRADDTLDVSRETEVHLTVTTRPVVISELMTANVASLETRIRKSPDDNFLGDPMTPDWIELENLTSQPLDIGGLYLTDDAGYRQKWQIPLGTTLSASGRLIVLATGRDILDTRLDEQGLLHTNFSLSSDGEYLALTDATGVVLHEYAPQYPPQLPAVSYGMVNGTPYFFALPTPGERNFPGLPGVVQSPEFSVSRGLFSDPFTLQITTTTPGATMVYTTDGSAPTLQNGIQTAAPDAQTSPTVEVSIAATTTLRAAAFKDGLLPTPVETQTYIFPADVVTQRVLSSTIKNNPVWGPQLEDALLALPTISLVTSGRISEVERATSVEMIFPDGTTGFQIDAGIEYYGGHSLGSPKKNMRLSFKSKYGGSKLNYDLFGDGAVDEFDQLLLRTGSHDTFFWTHPGGAKGNYIRNRWAFDRQLEMGQPAPHGRFVHVYVDGTYWGQHQLMERPEASFMASYFGGWPEDYDALNAGVSVDGDLAAWNAMRRNAVIDDYEQLQKYLDVVNYADYMLLQFYGGNDWDWNESQNWMAARRREEEAGFQFFSWDSDVILRTGANANVINRGGPGNLWNANGGVKQHDEFKMLLADRAQKYFFNGGMFTDERLRHDIDALADQIRLSMIAETARWGGQSYTPTAWEQAIEWVKTTYAPDGTRSRATTVIEQMRRAGVYPSIDAPSYTVAGVPQHGGSMSARDELGMSAAQGTIYYTLDGTDPRMPGGALSPTAVLFDGEGITLDRPTVVKSRSVYQEEWSALSEAEFRVDVVAADASSLRISEVHYHPADPSPAEMAAGYTDADDFEFIELTNISDGVIDLTDVQLQKSTVEGNENGVDFVFAEGAVTLLGPGEYVVVVEDLDAFGFRYGADINVAGQWSGKLDNSGEQLTLVAGAQTIHQFSYSDRWHPQTDGQGPSLEIINVAGAMLADWGQPTSWRPSDQLGGSPGMPVASPVPGDANGDGIFNSSDLVQVFQIGEYEDGVPNNSTFAEGDWNGDGDFDSSDLVLAFQAGMYVAAAEPAASEYGGRHRSAVRGGV